MDSAKDLARANIHDAFMLLIAERRNLYNAYRRGGWVAVHDELVDLLRVAGRQEADQLAQALKDVLRYLIKGYGLGRCPYVLANPIPKGASAEEVEGHELRGETFSDEATVLKGAAARLLGHHFLTTSGRRVPKWCPDHSLAARQRTYRQKMKSRRSGKFI